MASSTRIGIRKTGVYALAITYVAAPLAGLHFDGASIISLVSSLPLWAKLSAKTIVGMPFWFHTWNGMRHLSWDMGYREFFLILLDPPSFEVMRTSR
jgi:succinate dehydrogenase/fumarate reductase cytochrome b subunit